MTDRHQPRHQFAVGFGLLAAFLGLTALLPSAGSVVALATTLVLLPGLVAAKCNDIAGKGDVTIVGKAPRRRFGEAQHWLMIGRDDLGGCSSVTYDRKSSSLIFRCRPAHLAGAAI